MLDLDVRVVFACSCCGPGAIPQIVGGGVRETGRGGDIGAGGGQHRALLRQVDGREGEGEGPARERRWRVKVTP